MLLENNPLWIVDVGAAGGLHARWLSLMPSSYNAVIFEPDKEAYEKLKINCAKNITVVNTALSKSANNMDFHVCRKPETSSNYKPNYDLLKEFDDVERFEIVTTIEMKTDTLTNQLKKNSIAEIDFMKIDVQGSELDILIGGVEYLDHIVGLEIEIEFLEVYKDQPLFNQVDVFLKNQNFELFDLKRYYWKRKISSLGTNKGQLIYGDALYFKNPEQILLIDDIDECKIIRSIYIYLSYGYVDLARDLINKATSKDLISTDVMNQLLLLLAPFKEKNKIPNFRGKGRIQKLINRVANIFSSEHFSSGSDENLGNPY